MRRAALLQTNGHLTIHHKRAPCGRVMAADCGYRDTHGFVDLSRKGECYEASDKFGVLDRHFLFGCDVDSQEQYEPRVVQAASGLLETLDLESLGIPSKRSQR